MTTGRIRKRIRREQSKQKPQLVENDKRLNFNTYQFLTENELARLNLISKRSHQAMLFYNETRCYNQLSKFIRRIDGKKLLGYELQSLLDQHRKENPWHSNLKKLMERISKPLYDFVTTSIFPSREDENPIKLLLKPVTLRGYFPKPLQQYIYQKISWKFFGEMQIADDMNPSLKYLLECGADVNYKPNGRATTFLYAMANRGISLAVIKGMLEAKANLNAFYEHRIPYHFTTRMTALMFASCYGPKERVQLLLEYKANVNQHFLPNRTSTAGIFYSYQTPLYFAALRNREDIARSLIEAKADLNIPDDKGSKPLMVALENESHFVFDLVLKKYIHLINFDDVNHSGKTALMIAAERGTGDHEEAVRLLIEHRANVHLEDEDGKTALNYADQAYKEDLANQRPFSQLSSSESDDEGLSSKKIYNMIKSETLKQPKRLGA